MTARRPTLMFVLGLAPQKIGGMEKFLRYLVVALDTAGWDSVLCFDGPIATEFRDYISGPFITVESLDSQGRLGLACARELWRLLQKHKPLTFVYAFHSVLRCFPWLAKLAGCKKVFFNDHSSRPQGQIMRPLSLPKRIVGRILTTPLCAIVSVSGFTRMTNDVLGVTSSRNVVVSNGVEIREIDLNRRIRFRERYGISHEDIVVTQLCWMVDEKGVETLLRAAQLFLQRHMGVRFLFVGDGCNLPKYQKLAVQLQIERAVIFTGILSNPTVLGVFDASDIYCQPSIWQEACPLAVLEAMSFKLPVIVSNTGGLPELVEDGGSGILVQVGESKEICAALEKLVKDTELRTKMGEEGYRMIIRGHRIEETARKYVDLFIAGDHH